MVLMIHATSLSLAFGSQKIFDDLSFIIDAQDRIGLVGHNGAGKSTLLKALAAQCSLDSGTIALQHGKKIAYLPQEVVLRSTKSVLDEAIVAYGDIDELEIPGALAEAKKILMGLGFSPDLLQLDVNQLSVGWKMKLALAKLLMQKADFYLFDEPTNHLDIFAKDWFLQFLKKASFGFMLVSHERYFLDTVCCRILELHNGNGKIYAGNYSFYQIQGCSRRTA
jgi:ATPase subunit of ABC transporter with duplicated ATPase domains